jgi:pimeloyl-ACP methyl ester carboxylesterase
MGRTIKQARITTAIQYSLENIASEPFLLAELARSDGSVGSAFEDFQRETGLADLYWQVLYYRSPGQAQTMAETIQAADGYVFFMHGWSGSHRIWESLPLQLVIKYKRIVCFSLDINGFGRSPFRSDTPREDQCSPAAVMSAIEKWLTIIGLWPQQHRRKRPFYLFVGHSMGGAATFYKDVTGWENETYGFYALAPALVCNDAQRQAFFKTLGLSIGLPSFTAVKDALAPHVIDIMGNGASLDVKNEHLRIYNKTPFGTIAQTMYVLGVLHAPPQRNDWARFRVSLGHRDRVVGLDNMLNLLQDLGFQSRQITVALGDHYFFSYGPGSPQSHQDNRQTLLDELVDFCQQLAGEARQKSDRI